MGGLRLTTQEFVRKARKVHGDRYSYDKVVYVRTNASVVITCRKHGDFQQVPFTHLAGCGCPKCGEDDRVAQRTNTTDQFIADARKVHGDRYSYDKVVYVRTNASVVITCRKHGDFQQRPDIHLRGMGCQKCGLETAIHSRLLTTKEFVRRAREVHGDTYDYSQSEYSGVHAKVIIICRVHGAFEQSANDHILVGCGCTKCAGERRSKKTRMSQDEFLRRARKVHGDKYDYSRVAYSGFHRKVDIICPKHGAFRQAPADHIHNGQGCPRCGNERSAVAKRVTQKEFIRRARRVHGRKYDYSRSVYLSGKRQVEIICPKHGSFWQMPQKHVLAKCGCPACGDSTGERIVRQTLDDMGIDFDQEARLIPGRLHRFDFHLPTRKILIEFNGVQHYRAVPAFGGETELIKMKARDRFKARWARDNGFTLIVVKHSVRDVDGFLRSRLARRDLA